MSCFGSLHQISHNLSTQASYLASHSGGVVTAEELAPFLDPPPLKRPRGGPNKYEDESFVLPALIRFGGEPFVGEDGALLYKFGSLQAGAAELRREAATARLPVEAEWGFSEADPGELQAVLCAKVVCNTPVYESGLWHSGSLYWWLLPVLIIVFSSWFTWLSQVLLIIVLHLCASKHKRHHVQ